MPSVRLLIAVLLVLVLAWAPAAHAGEEFTVPALDSAPKAAADKALVVFIRPRFLGGSKGQAAIYDAPDNAMTFLGLVPAKSRMAVAFSPGPRRLMVIGENADFLDATLEPGKTYYVMVRQRPGGWAARYSLLPIHTDATAKYSVHTADFREWSRTLPLLDKTPAADAWHREHEAEVAGKKSEYLRKWDVMLPVDRAVLTLHAEDGVAP